MDKDKKELAAQLEERKAKADKAVVHKPLRTRPHTLGKDCWCNPSVEEVPYTETGRCKICAGPYSLCEGIH